MFSKRGRPIAILFFVIVLFFLAWICLYPNPADPKNIKYVLWKSHLYPMNLDLATSTMIGDPHRDDLVIGKTKEQLVARFGYLVPPAQASPYFQTCLESTTWKNQPGLFIRRSNWLVIFTGDQASSLVLFKGC